MTPLAKILISLALLAALFSAEQYVEHLGATRARAEADLAIQKLKTQAATDLADEKEKTRAVEQTLQDFTAAQNLKDNTHEQIVSTLADRVRNLLDPAGRLRDPHAQGCRGSGGGTTSATGGSAGDRPANQTEAGGLLSAELSGLLQRLTIEADRINEAYASCRAIAVNDRETLKH